MPWEDVSRYGQSEKEHEVKTVEVRPGGVRVVVTRMHGCEGWWLHMFGVDLKEEELQGKDLEMAKAEAVERVRHRLTRILEELPQWIVRCAQNPLLNHWWLMNFWKVRRTKSAGSWLPRACGIVRTDAINPLCGLRNGDGFCDVTSAALKCPRNLISRKF